MSKRTIADRKVELKERAIRINELADEFETEDKMVTIHEDSDIVIYKEVKVHNSDVYLSYYSTTHWSTPVEVNFRNVGEDRYVNVNTSSGGVISDATNLQRVKAMKAIFTEIETMLENSETVN